jgi:hypothetical protein
MTVNELLDTCLDGLDSDDRLSAKTRFDYRSHAQATSPLLGSHKVPAVTPDVIVAWQRRLAESGGAKGGKSLTAYIIRLARAPLAERSSWPWTWVSWPSRR